MNINKFMGLNDLVKIYSYGYELEDFGEDYKTGDLVVKNGTILKKLLRCKAPVHNIRYCHIALVDMQANAWQMLPEIVGKPSMLPEATLYRESSRQLADESIPFDEFSMTLIDDEFEKSIFQSMNDLHQRSKLRGLENKEVHSLYNPSLTSHQRIGSESILGGPQLESTMANMTEKCYIELDSIVNRKHDVFRKIMNIYNPQKEEKLNVVFSQYALPFRILDILSKSGVLAVFPLTLEEMELLSITLGCRISTEDILTNQRLEIGSEYINSVSNFYCFENRNKEDRTESHIILMDKEVNELYYRSLGMLVYGQDAAENSFFTEFLREKLAFIYYLILEKTVCSFERNLLDGGPHIGKVEKSQTGDFRTSLADSCYPFRQLATPAAKIKTTKVTLVRLTTENAYKDLDKDFHIKCGKFSEVIKKQDIMAKLEKPKEFNQFEKLLDSDDLEIFSNLNLTKVDFLAMQVGEPVVARVGIYSREDKTLGIFLRNRFEIFEKLNDQTGLKVKDHVTLMYVADCCIRVTLDDYEGELDYPTMRAKMRRGKKFTNVNFNRIVWLENYKKKTEAKNRDKGTTNRKQNKKLSNFSKDQTRGQDKRIYCSIVCNVCHSQLTNRFFINKEYMNVSYMVFLMNMATKRKVKRSFNNKSKMQSFNQEADNVPTCDHPHQARAFIQGNKTIKFTRLDLKIFNIQILNHLDIKEGVAYTMYRQQTMQANLVRGKENQETFLRIAKYYRKQMLLVWYLARETILKIVSFSHVEDSLLGLDGLGSNIRADKLGYKRLRKIYFVTYNCLQRISDLIWLADKLFKRKDQVNKSRSFRAIMNLTVDKDDQK